MDHTWWERTLFAGSSGQNILGKASNTSAGSPSTFSRGAYVITTFLNDSKSRTWLAIMTNVCKVIKYIRSVSNFSLSYFASVKMFFIFKKSKNIKMVSLVLTILSSVENILLGFFFTYWWSKNRVQKKNLNVFRTDLTNLNKVCLNIFNILQFSQTLY